MRKSNRALTTEEEILNVLDRCDVLRIALNNDTYPYVVPVSFGWELVGERPYLYIHGASEGLRHDLLRRDNRVCVEADCFNGYRLTSAGTTCDYESVIGFGRVEVITGDEAYHGLEVLLRHCGVEGKPPRPEAIPNLSVWRIAISQFTGKRHHV